MHTGLAEHFEGILGEALAARTECLTTWRELGGPDLCHVVKQNPKASTKEIGSYHYVHGVDTSSSAAIAAYINSLSYSLGVLPGGKIPAPHTNPYKLVRGTFCSFNSFSRVDVRVEVSIPGGVDAYLVDLRGDRHPIPNALIWQETAVSSTLRCLLDDSDDPEADDISTSIMCLKRIDPLPTRDLESKFLAMCEDEFWKGWQLGTNSDIQVATAVFNHLSNGILTYFTSSYRLGEGAKFFEQLFLHDEQVGALLAKCYLGDFNEIKAVKIIHDAFKSGSYNYALLLLQIDFLMGKKRLEQALLLAKIAVTNAPCEFMTWAKLTEVYMEIGDYESCLLALNSCPMFSYVEKDAHRMPMPARTHLPIKHIYDDPKNPAKPDDPKESEVHPDLLRIPAASLRGTFKKAYQLLIGVVGKIGWDALLQVRANVFVMEDEYRVHRAILAENQESPKNASLTTTGKLVESPAEVPSSDTNLLSEAMDSVSLTADLPSKSPKKGHTKKLSVSSMLQATGGGVEPLSDPVSATAGQHADSVSSDGSPTKYVPNPRLPWQSISYSFKHKRLCEKWLDNLFMVLYQDLRLFTGMKQEMSPLGNPKKTGAEWEIYGDLSLRLNFKTYAREAYVASVQGRKSIRAQVKLLLLDSRQGDALAVMQSLAKIVENLDKAYIDHILPSPVSKAVFRLISRHGLAKIQNVLISLKTPPHVFKLISKYFEYAEVFKVQGYDW